MGVTTSLKMKTTRIRTLGKNASSQKKTTKIYSKLRFPVPVMSACQSHKISWLAQNLSSCLLNAFRFGALETFQILVTLLMKKCFRSSWVPGSSVENEPFLNKFCIEMENWTGIYIGKKQQLVTLTPNILNAYRRRCTDGHVCWTTWWPVCSRETISTAGAPFS